MADKLAIKQTKPFQHPECYERNAQGAETEEDRVVRKASLSSCSSAWKDQKESAMQSGSGNEEGIPGR